MRGIRNMATRATDQRTIPPHATPSIPCQLLPARSMTQLTSGSPNVARQLLAYSYSRWNSCPLRKLPHVEGPRPCTAA